MYHGNARSINRHAVPGSSWSIVCLSVCLSVSVNLSVCLCVSLYLYVCVCVEQWQCKDCKSSCSAWLRLFSCLCVCLSVCLYVYVCLCLYVCLYVCVCVERGNARSLSRRAVPGSGSSCSISRLSASSSSPFSSHRPRHRSRHLTTTADAAAGDVVIDDGDAEMIVDDGSSYFSVPLDVKPPSWLFTSVCCRHFYHLR